MSLDVSLGREESSRNTKLKYLQSKEITEVSKCIFERTKELFIKKIIDSNLADWAVVQKRAKILERKKNTKETIMQKAETENKINGEACGSESEVML